MLNNSWFKKEKPILGVTGFGGGAASLFRAGGATPMEATGGNYVLTPGNGYKYHTFTASGSFVCSELGDTGEIEVLVVGGGGGGGNGGGEGGGGGGAGGLRNFDITLTAAGPATYPITVGDGGAAINYDTWPHAPGTGTESSFNSPGGNSITKVVASGGGCAGTYENPGSTSPGAQIDGSPGGSGGGGGAYQHGGQQGGTDASPDGRSPTAQGNLGGGGSTFYSNRGSGGGGAGAGGNWGGASAGPGPAGLSKGGDGSPIPGFSYTDCFPTPVSNTMATPTNAVSGYVASPTSDHYAAGGGGGATTSPGWGAILPGGIGGGGGGGSRNSPTPGTDQAGFQGTNYLGGGGGGSAAGNSSTTGPGGEGVVIVRYVFA